MTKFQWFHLVVGTWLVMSPWLLAYDDVVAVRAHLMYGLLLTALATISAIIPLRQSILARVAFATGVWLILSPWVLSYADDGWAGINGVLVGGVTASIALETFSARREVSS